MNAGSVGNYPVTFTFPSRPRREAQLQAFKVTLIRERMGHTRGDETQEEQEARWHPARATRSAVSTHLVEALGSRHGLGRGAKSALWRLAQAVATPSERPPCELSR